MVDRHTNLTFIGNSVYQLVSVSVCTTFGLLILSKIIKIVATRSYFNYRDATNSISVR